jgi:hypothetical protein
MTGEFVVVVASIVGTQIHQQRTGNTAAEQ